MTQRGSYDFFKDENIQWQAATYADVAPGPNESANAIFGDGDGASPLLQGIRASGGAVTPLSLADIEIDNGLVSADGAAPDDMYDADDLNAPAGNVFAPTPAAPDMSEANLDRLVDLLAAKLEKRLLGD